MDFALSDRSLDYLERLTAFDKELVRPAEAVYRRQRHVYNFTRRYYLVGRDDLIARLHLRPGERAIEVGCGTARNLISVARRYPGTQLFGIDASLEMLRTAQQAVASAGLSRQIVLAHGYAEALTPGFATALPDAITVR